VVRDTDGVAARDAARPRVLAGQLDLGLGALELQLRHTLDRRAREERLVADQAQAVALRGRRLLWQLGRRRLRAGAQQRVLADLAERQPVVDLGRELREDRRRERVDLHAEALGELRDPGELVRRGRDRRAAQALQPALEVDVRAVALEVARARQDEV